MKLKSIEEEIQEVYENYAGEHLVAEALDDLEKVYKKYNNTKNRQHLIQTIRKEVEGIPAHLVDIRQNADDKPEYKDAVLIDDILTLLTTLEEEVVE